MAPQDPEASLKFLLTALNCATELKIDYHKLAEVLKIANANSAQKKYKAIVEADGKYQLVGSMVTAVAGKGEGDGDENGAPAATATAPKTPRKRKAVCADDDAPNTPSAKKKKISTPRSNTKTKASVAKAKAEKAEQSKNDEDEGAVSNAKAGKHDKDEAIAGEDVLEGDESA